MLWTPSRTKGQNQAASQQHFFKHEYGGHLAIFNPDYQYLDMRVVVRNSLLLLDVSLR
jgi:hypothetical protein